MALETPYYLIDERRLLKNLKIIRRIREFSGAKSILALKCFSAWSVFKLLRQYMDGTTASSVYEARLGYEKFGKETQVYSVGYSQEDIKELRKFADKVIFNSVSQLKSFYPCLRGTKIGLRLNPGVSYSQFDLADPARKYSRLGITDKKSIEKVLALISGVMLHFNCENDDFKDFFSNLERISRKYADIFRHLEWVSLGGGLYFTKKGYPVEEFCSKIKDFSRRFNVQVYLEPGESVITQSGELVTRVLDVVHNKVDIAIVDASTEAHMLDLLIYRTPAKIKDNAKGKHKYIIGGRSCLAGDVFGTFRFRKRLKTGDIIRISDAAGYTMVKKNWFNGLKMPAIAIKRLNGKIDVVRRFSYKDFLNSLS
ncbi:MAG: carboxynorspermidine decarboxylase [Candidatus Omnitrophica bacterium]|nr:carboxynorspermidine decarboxylase [Candidatus Omnitrophota bacterium]